MSLQTLECINNKLLFYITFCCCFVEPNLVNLKNRKMKTFEIIEKSTHGRPNKVLQDSFPGIPIILFNKTQISFKEVACEKLRLSKNSEILISKVENDYYLANVTDHWKEGYKLTHKNGSKTMDSLQTQSHALAKKIDIKKGIYQIDGFAEYDEQNKLEWFKIIPISYK